MYIQRILLTSYLTLLIYSSFGQEIDFQKKYAPDSLKAWTRTLMDEVAKGHPGMYRYTPKSVFDSLIQIQLNSIQDSLNTLEYYRKVKPLFAKIGCLHTSVNLSPAYEDYYEKSLKLIPLEIFIDQNKKVFVSKVYAPNQSIPLKSEIISIDGRDIATILDILYQAIPSDGYNESLKTLLLNHRFAFWYQAIISKKDEFVLNCKVNGLAQKFLLKGLSKEVFPDLNTLEGNQEKQLSLKVEEGIAYLKIRSFAKSVIKKNGQNFKKFIRKSFQTLEKEAIENLVIDLRYNSGGSDGHAVFLARHFFERPFDYWEKIEVTESIFQQIKGKYKIFYKKPRQVDSTFQWRGARWWVSKEFNYYKKQKPAKNIFRGETYILSNGLCMSSCSDVIAILAHNQKARVIGQESGGGYQGNTSGLMPNNSIFANLVMTIPLQKYTNAVDPSQNFGRGTLPDNEIYPQLDDWINKRDVELNFVKELIKK